MSFTPTPGISYDLSMIAESLYAQQPRQIMVLEGYVREGCLKYTTLKLLPSDEELLSFLTHELAQKQIYNVQYPEDGMALQGAVSYQSDGLDEEQFKEFNTLWQDGPVTQVFGYCPRVRILLQPLYEAEAVVRDNDYPRCCDKKMLQEIKEGKRLAREAHEKVRYGL